jgi:6-carboxyhexanoate--CoA ligase
MSEVREFCVKMRASRCGEHVSGAERIVDERLVPRAVAALAERALSHEKGTPDFINIKVEEPGEMVRLKALAVSTNEVSTAAEGRARAAQLLAEAGVGRANEIMALFRESYSMRGAMLVDADTLERLEPDRERGVRATRMDAADTAVCGVFRGKNHFAEAVVLATKVANAPGIVGEVCVSDDPGYVTGYVAAKSIGYQRITVMKEAGDPCGGRIFLYRGPREDVEKCIRFLERQSVIVEGAPSAPNAPGEVRLDGIVRELDAIEQAGLSRSCRALHSPTGPTARVDVDGAMRDVVVLASNDYLDLARDPRVTGAAAAAAHAWGAGSGGSRLTTGTQPPHEALERRIAAFKGEEAAILYATGYMANVGVVTALAGKGDVVFSDELNHASIIDGCRLSGADVVVYRHGDMDELARRLAAARACRRRVVVSDGVFSMDGDILDLPRFLAVCRANDAFSVVDEAHATGVVGRTGRGLVEHFGCGHPDVTVGTLSKALGSEGGFACGAGVIVKYLRNRSRPFIFSTAPGAPAVASGEAALAVLEAEPWRVAALRENVAFFLGELAGHGVAARSESAIVPIIVGDERRAVKAAEALLREGFLVSAIRYPTVARGAARLRVAVMSAHTKEQLAAAAAAIARCGMWKRENVV